MPASCSAAAFLTFLCPLLPPVVGARLAPVLLSARSVGRTVRLVQHLALACWGPKVRPKLGQRIVASSANLLRHREPDRVGRFAAADLEEPTVRGLGGAICPAAFRDGACGLAEPAHQVEFGVLQRPRIPLRELMPLLRDLACDGLMPQSGYTLSISSTVA